MSVGKESKTSVVVPCFNCENYIIRCIESLLNQTTPFREIILVDDGSNDATSFICDQYAETNINVKVLHQSNKGLMLSWKRGVALATSEYIVFCDSDDYVDLDYNSELTKVVELYHSDMILFGMKLEYSNGDRVNLCNSLEQGLYNREDIENRIWPCLLSDGSMQSELISKSRCDKAFRRSLLISIMDELPDDVSFGEDDITTFASILEANSVYCMGNYFPYHYVRNAESMIGKYDSDVFSKIEKQYIHMEIIAEKWEYPYKRQLVMEHFSTIVLFLKKEICRNPNGLKNIILKLRQVTNDCAFKSGARIWNPSKYSLPSMVFTKLIINQHFISAIFLVKCFELIRGRDT